VRTSAMEPRESGRHMKEVLMSRLLLIRLGKLTYKKNRSSKHFRFLNRSRMDYDPCVEIAEEMCESAISDAVMIVNTCKNLVEEF